jgi:hypothetical protein
MQVSSAQGWRSRAGPIGLELAVALKRAASITSTSTQADWPHDDVVGPGTRFFTSNERIAIAGVRW